MSTIVKVRDQAAVPSTGCPARTTRPVTPRTRFVITIALLALGVLLALLGSFYLAPAEPGITFVLAILILFVIVALLDVRDTLHLFSGGFRTAAALIRDTGWAGMIVGAFIINLTAAQLWIGLYGTVGHFSLWYYPVIVAIVQVVLPAFLGAMLFGPGLAGPTPRGR